MRNLNFIALQLRCVILLYLLSKSKMGCVLLEFSHYNYDDSFYTSSPYMSTSENENSDRSYEYSYTETSNPSSPPTVNPSNSPSNVPVLTLSSTDAPIPVFVPIPLTSTPTRKRNRKRNSDKPSQSPTVFPSSVIQTPAPTPYNSHPRSIYIPSSSPSKKPGSRSRKKSTAPSSIPSLVPSTKRPNKKKFVPSSIPTPAPSANPSIDDHMFDDDTIAYGNGDGKDLDDDQTGGLPTDDRLDDSPSAVSGNDDFVTAAPTESDDDVDAIHPTTHPTLFGTSESSNEPTPNKSATVNIPNRLPTSVPSTVPHKWRRITNSPTIAVPGYNADQNNDDSAPLRSEHSHQATFGEVVAKTFVRTLAALLLLSAIGVSYWQNRATAYRYFRRITTSPSNYSEVGFELGEHPETEQDPVDGQGENDHPRHDFSRVTRSAMMEDGKTHS